MSQRANYFKLGLFVIGAIVAGVLVLLIVGTRALSRARVIIETYFKESVQGSTSAPSSSIAASTIGEVTRITFTYTGTSWTCRSRSASAT